MTQLDTAHLRKTLRDRRHNLTAEQQKQHALQACQHLLQSEYIQNAKQIALFLSQDGELDTQPVIEELWQLKDKTLFLPALKTQPDWYMGFSPYAENTPLHNNQFNIPEPDVTLAQHITGQELELVIMPLVGFDKEGNRLGMGGGYYDRTFEFKLNSPHSKPLLIGWAHSCQQVEKLNSESWDVPLNGIITENGIIQWS